MNTARILAMRARAQQGQGSRLKGSTVSLGQRDARPFTGQQTSRHFDTIAARLLLRADRHDDRTEAAAGFRKSLEFEFYLVAGAWRTATEIDQAHCAG